MSLVRADEPTRFSKDKKMPEVAEVVETEKVNPFKAEVDAENAKASGKGLRHFYGNTRGKGSMPIRWSGFDESKPDTLPTDIKEFTQLTGVTSSEKLLEFLITGFNDAQYTAASDPIAEHVNAAWDDDTKTQFRNVVRNLSKAMGKSIDEVVTMVKPGIEQNFAAKGK